jgi:hypothetical protein
MNAETCPMCGAVMEPHIVKEDDQLYELWYCDSCMADYLPVGFGEWVGLHDCHGTRPIDTTHTREALHDA